MLNKYSAYGNKNRYRGSLRYANSSYMDSLYASWDLLV